MRMQAKWILVGALSMSATAPVATANAGRLYLGLPAGTNVAYVRGASDAAWTRDAAADLPDVGYYGSPTLGDLDGDGDRDALVGEAGGKVFAYVNTGSDTAPVWIRQPGWDPVFDAGDRAAPALADLDGDGDLDLLIGNTTGTLAGFENVGSRAAPAWRARHDWDLTGFGAGVHAALGDVDRDGRLDLFVGLEQGEVWAYAGTGGTPSFARRTDWDPPPADRPIATLGDVDGDGRLELIVADGRAVGTVYRFTGSGWSAVPALAPPDPGSGPAVPAFVPVGAGNPGPAATPRPTATVASGGGSSATATTAAPTPRPTATAGTPGAPVARLAASPTTGAPPLAVAFDASASSGAAGTTLTFGWDFGDGTTAGGAPPADPAAAIAAGAAAYDAAKATRDAGHYATAVAQYLDDVALLLPLTGITTAGPITVGSTNRIDRAARWYLQRIGHDLGGLYLFHSVGLGTCQRYATSLQYSRESASQAVLGGFPQQPDLNGTSANIADATQHLIDNGCSVPAPQPMFVASGGAAARITHTYAAAGRYVAQVAVSDGTARATASVAVTVGDTTPPPPPPGGGDGSDDPLEGFGASTPGGSGGRVIHVTEATDAAAQSAFKAAKSGNAIVMFDVTGPIELQDSLEVPGPFVTIEGNGVTLLGNRLGWQPTLEVTGHDVIVRNVRLRNGSDNLRAQGPGAYNVVFSHVSSTGALDDGVSIGYGAHDVTLQYGFLAGNTRSVFMKYNATTDVSLHHNWIMKQWARGPLVSTNIVADVRNDIVEDWTLWGMRFEKLASGNLVNSLFTLGPTAKALGGSVDGAFRITTTNPVFTAGNVFQGLARRGADGKAPAPIDAPPVTTWSVAEMEPIVRARAGCLPRDAVDAKYVATTTGWRVGATTALRLTVP